MLVGLMRKMMTSMSVRGVRYIKATRPGSAYGLVAETYRQMERDFIVGAPFALHSPIPEVLAGMWAATRESLVAGSVARGEKEDVARTVSEINECPYCVSIHSETVSASMFLDASNAEGKYREWARATLTPDSPLLKRVPFSESHAPEIIGTALAFHYINRVVNIFLDDSPMPIPSFMESMMSRMAAPMMRDIVSRIPAPGDSLGLLPESEVPADMAWAAANPTVARAWARFAHAVETCVKEEMGEAARESVMDILSRWHGEDPGFGTDWVDELLIGLRDREKPSAKLALLTAVASYRVTPELIAEFQMAHPGDRALVTVTSWAGLAATRRISSWVGAPETFTG